jgi:hypothetical protein
MRLSLLCLALAASPAFADGDWEELLVSGEKSPWKKIDEKAWIFAKDAKLESKEGKLLEAVEPGKGPVWVNGTKGRLPDLITTKDYKDVEVHVEFLLGKNSNAGIKFHAVYEIQLLEMTNKKGPLTGASMGGIYPRAELKPKYHHIDEGIPPKVNAAKPAGEWQTLVVTFRSPRLDSKGEKTANATVVKAVLNDQVIHENQEFKTPTGNNHTAKEKAAGPFMLQCDHGPTAWRNVKIREVK